MLTRFEVDSRISTNFNALSPKSRTPDWAEVGAQQIHGNEEIKIGIY